MNSKKLFVIFLVTLLSVGQAAKKGGKVDASIQNEALARFLETSMDQFPAWLSERGLDPSPPVAGPVQLMLRNNMVELDCEISNFYVSGISSGLQTFSAYADLTTSFFSFLSIPGSGSPNYISLGGNYRANGTVLSNLPLEASGQWRLVINELDQTVRVEGFQITPDGYVDIMNAAARTMTTETTPIVAIAFDGLLDNAGLGGLGAVVEDGLGKALKNFVKESSTYPAMDQLLTYLNDVFSNTPLADIIAEPTTPFMP